MPLAPSHPAAGRSGESPLRIPEGGLGRIAERLWLQSRRSCDAEGRFEVLPDSHFGIGIVLAGGRCRLVAGGPVTERFFAYPHTWEAHWVRFRPGLLPRIADVAPADLIGVPGFRLDRLKGVSLDALEERLCSTPCPETRLRILERFMEPLGEVSLCQDSRCRRILEMVDSLDGRVTVQGISDEFGLSARTVQRLLASQVGLSPKQLIQNVRLQRTIARMKREAHRFTLAGLASECGYTDQSHMINDFRKRTGRTPASF